jgi:hypothetical protein
VHTGRAPLAQKGQQLRALAGTAQRQRIDATRHQVHRLPHLVLGVVAAGRNEQLQPVVGQAPLQGVDGLGEDGVVHGRKDGADGARALQHQRPRAGVRHIAECGHRGQHAQAQRLAHRLPVEQARDGGGGNPRRRRHVLQARPLRAGGLGQRGGLHGWHCTRLQRSVPAWLCSARRENTHASLPAPH